MRFCRVSAAACLFLAACHGPERETPADTSGPLAAGSELDAVDESGVALHFRVDGLQTDPQATDAEVTLYALSVRRPGSDAFEPYCTPDGEGRSVAVVVEGSWDARGSFRDAPGVVTFACTSGAIGKCVRFGYQPWRTVGGTSLRDHHLACVRMVRADYCGDGTSHTRDGTRIDLWDELGVQRREEAAGHPEAFEAAWSPEGAVYLATPRWSDDVADIVALCPDKLRGRTRRELVLEPAQLSKRFPEAKLFNARFLRDEDRLTRRRD